MTDTLTVTAPDMLRAQAVRLTPEQIAALQARADRRRARWGNYGPEVVVVPVRDPHDGARIGDLRFEL